VYDAALIHPRLATKRLYGILATMDIQEGLKEQLYQARIYLAMIHQALDTTIEVIYYVNSNQN
jgi:hypothetical protein